MLNSFTYTSFYSQMAIGYILISLLYPLSMAAQTRPSLRLTPHPLIPTLSRRGMPIERQAAGTRGNCPAVQNRPDLTALVPLFNAEPEERSTPIVLGFTTEAFPTLWFYLPYPSEAMHSVNFKLLDETGRPITDEVPVPVAQNHQGVIGFRLPETEQLQSGLSVGQAYRWQIRIDCLPGNSVTSVDTYIEAGIWRIEPSSELVRQLAAASPMEQVEIYAAHGLWYDAVTKLQALRQQTGSNEALDTDWQTLLDSIGLAQFGASL
jgi:hypothetical protein